MNPLKQTLDLASVGAIFKSQKPIPEVPEILAVVTLKGDALASTLAAIEAAGFSVQKSDEQADGSVLLPQVDSADMSEAVVVIKMGDHTALVVKGFSPYSMQMDNVDGMSFSDICKAQGFYPGMRTTMDVLSSSVFEVASKSEDQTSAAEAVSKMFDEAKSYAVSMVKALPSKAFKLEAIEFKEETPAPDAAAIAAAEAAAAAAELPEEEIGRASCRERVLAAV